MLVLLVLKADTKFLPLFAVKAVGKKSLMFIYANKTPAGVFCLYTPGLSSVTFPVRKKFCFVATKAAKIQVDGQSKCKSESLQCDFTTLF